jgi:hypothetical protein
MLRPAGGRSYLMPALLGLPILIKAVSTVLLVIVASSLAEALGPFWGALVASLPVSAGPAYVFLAMQHDADFLAAAALRSCAANAATGVFLIVYARLVGRLRSWRGLGVSVAVWLALSLAMRWVVWTPVTASVLNLAVYGIGFRLLPGVATVAAGGVDVAPNRWFDLPVRATAVGVFVSGVVVCSSALGPAATGTAAVFPVSLLSLFVVLQPWIGAVAAAVLAANALRAMLGFGLMLLVLHLAIRPLGSVAALFVALAVSAAWSGGLLMLRGRAGGVRVAAARGPDVFDIVH